MANVYLADDLRHDRHVALKVLRPELATALGPERFLQEIQFAARLAHPHILPLYDSGEADGFLFYVMPYVKGESLRDRLDRQGPLPIDEAIRIVREVADGLSHAHSLGVVHRDLKPENILFMGGHAVVADFGVASAVGVAGGHRLTETGISVGTPAYMSPEQAVGDSRVDGRSDTYALGCVLYEMLAGDPPYAAPSPQAMMARKLSESPPGLSTTRETIAPALESVVRRRQRSAYRRPHHAGAAPGGRRAPALVHVLRPPHQRHLRGAIGHRGPGGREAGRHPGPRRTKPTPRPTDYESPGVYSVPQGPLLLEPAHRREYPDGPGLLRAGGEPGPGIRPRLGRHRGHLDLPRLVQPSGAARSFPAGQERDPAGP
jgi:serine/threonine protein kinase